MYVYGKVIYVWYICIGIYTVQVPMCRPIHKVKNDLKIIRLYTCQLLRVREKGKQNNNIYFSDFSKSFQQNYN